MEEEEVTVADDLLDEVFGNPNPSATVHVWPMQHPVLASLLWSAALLVIFAPLAMHLYRRRTTD